MSKAKKAAPKEEEVEEEEEENMGGIDAEMIKKFTDPNYSENFVAALPEKVRARVRGLQGIQKQYNDLYHQYTAELAQLDKKYESEYKPLYERRRDIVSGKVEPADDEVQRGFPEEHKGHVSLVEGERTEIKGIPGFWLRALKNDRRLREWITPRDEACLAHLVDIQSVLMENPSDGFTLVFVFNANEFFEETVLTKEYKLEEDDGELMLQKATGCTITWKTGKNLTVEEKRKKQRSKKTKEVRYVTTLEPCDSFFNFFSPPNPEDEHEEEEDEEDYGMEDKVEMDYEAGQIIKERIIVRAVEYFTGEADSGSDDEEEYDDEEEEEEEEEEPQPVKGKSGRGAGGAAGGRGGAAAGQQDCKQQ